MSNKKRNSKKDSRNYKENTKKYYAAMADDYPLVVSDWRMNLISKYNSEEKKILDLGCGTGNYLLVLPNKYVTGIDFSKESLDVLKKRKEFKKAKNKITAIKGDITKMPFKRDEFDLCFSFSTLYNIQEVDAALSEISRVTKKGGVAILELANKRSINSIWDRIMFKVPQFHWKKSYLDNIIKKAGFEVLEIKYRNVIPDFFHLFDKGFISIKPLQKISFRLIYVLRKK